MAMLDDTKLFDFIKIMFTKRSLYSQLKQHAKKRHHFMINRFFAIKYPSNANMFNINGIDGASVVDAWSLVAARFTSVPGWIYTKTKAIKKQAVDKNQYIPTDKAIEVYMQKYDIGTREFTEMQKYASDSLNQELQSIDKSIQVY
tara:strand:- start:805 stop:1239 length:435 start_codon:yes stop_codon:yes gene_type:complete